MPKARQINPSTFLVLGSTKKCLLILHEGGLVSFPLSSTKSFLDLVLSFLFLDLNTVTANIKEVYSPAQWVYAQLLGGVYKLLAV